MPGHENGLRQPTLRWLSDRKKCVKHNPITNTQTTYEAVQFNDLEIFVGDYVLVNADTDEPDAVATCDVARIEHLFESTRKADKFRANVQWYSKPQRIPKSIDTDHMDDEYEVVEEYRKFDSDVSVESIYRKCRVINAYEDDIPEDIRWKQKDHSMPTFVCRYRLRRMNNKYHVEPVLKLDALNPEDSHSCSGSVDTDTRYPYRYLPNVIIAEAPNEGANSRSKRRNSEVDNPKTPKSESKLKPGTEAKLRYALRKCSIDSDSEAQRYSSPGKRKSSVNQDSDFENSPRSTPKKNTPRSNRKNETPLKSNRINTLASSPKKSRDHKTTNESNDVVKETPAKHKPATPSKKRRISSSSEESVEPRSRSVSPEIDRVGPPATYKLVPIKGQTFVIKTPISIEKKVASKKLDEMDISGMLSSDDSDHEAILEKFEKNGTKIVARSKSDDTGFELLNTPNRNVNFSNDTVNAETPKSVRRNLTEVLDVGDSRDARKDLLLKKMADKREDASLRIKLRRSSEQSTYKIDSDSDGGAGNRTRRRNVVGTPKSILKVNSRAPGSPSVQFSNRDEIKEYSPNTEPSKETIKVEIKLKRVDHPEAVRKSPRTKISSPKYLDYYEVVSPTVSRNVTPKKLSRRTIHRMEVDEDDDEKKNTRITRQSIHNIGFSQNENSTSKKKQTRETSRKDKMECSDEESDKSEAEISANRTPRRTRNSVNNSVNESNVKTPSKSVAAKKGKTEDVPLTRTPRSSRKQKADVASTPTRKGSKLEFEPVEPTTPKRSVATPKTQTPSKSVKNGLLTPSMRQRNISVAKPATPLQEARARLHVSAVPKSLPCREEEFNNIYTFLEGKLMDNSGGCLYISGVPGTGKTATVTEVIRCLKKSVSKGKVDNFEFLEINGMKLTEPRQAYVEILKQLTGKKTTWEQAHQLLDKRFTNAAPRRRMTLLVVDELDILCNKRQDVVYNLLDWPAKSSAQLVVITIANTMDLPERVLMGRVTSRLGLTRLTFQPYTHKQLQEIVTARLNDSHAFKSEAIQLVARKVAAVSGDARRALDICRRATEVAEVNRSEIVSMQDVNEALTEMIASAKVQAIKHCSEMERTFLQAVCAEVARTGVEEVTFNNIYIQLTSLCSLEGFPVPSVTEAITICARLGASRLLICEHSRTDIYQRVLLNVSSDDVHFSMQNIDV